MTFFKNKETLLHYKWIDKRMPRTFLLINSLGTDFRIWEGVVDTLKPHGNVLMFDNRGHGLSAVIESTNGLTAFADDAEALLKHLKIERFIPVGLSVGGMIAMLLAERIPQKIEKLILCDTCHKIATQPFWNERIALIKEKGLSSVSESVMLRWFSEKFRSSEEATVLGYRHMLERCPIVGYIKTCEAIRDADLTAIASQIKIPTLCIVGSEDKSTTPEEVKSLSNLIEGARYEVIPGSGHIPCVDNPVALSRLIGEFVG
jgi:3-oxoadipate enol-lactonase